MRRERVRREQAAFQGALQKAIPGATIERTYQVVLNGFALRVPPAEAMRILSQLPHVTGVYEEMAFKPALYNSVPALELEQVWAAAGGADSAGKDVRVAVLDSGIDIDHPMFSPGGLTYPPGYPKGEAAYTTPKVIAARAYFRPTAPPLAGESSPVPGPLGSAHGTHLASIVAGHRVTARYRDVQVSISGVAPAARLMNYRLFYPSADATEEVAFSAEVLQAIEDAVADGAQVILAGWASVASRPPIGAALPIAQALEAAMDAGCVVVAPVGNGGPAIGSASLLPGGMQRVITVGAVSKSQILAPDVIDVPQADDPAL
ncbi:MAG: S8 family serine peptidase, partial [Chloroflexi bacterium]|nr:S8 family serine peptidase [Chloroflexota bacterium]